MPTSVLLLGAATSVRQVHALLQADHADLVAIGCLVPTPDDRLLLPVLGGFDNLEQVLDEHPVDLVLVSLPAAMATVARDVADRLDRRGVAWRFLPTLADQLAGRAASPALPRAGFTTATLDTLQLIDRHPRPLDEQAIRHVLEGRVVLITGAGGSIGSELARRVAAFNPARLLLVERSENALFEIDRQIARLHPTLPRAALLHDVTDAPRTLTLAREYLPGVIFHAAAHKHVPMMEDHPAQAVENNFYGTRSIADAAAAVNTERFVMISTDKAVNPSSVMGATKRLAELYIQALGQRSRTRFSMVRFGNVLGSACSVLPIWSQQLAAGSPVTVTHPDMTRYFMTIPEAAGLVLQSASLSAEQGCVFLLDMGQPVRIVDLAQRFIRSHGLEPGVDVPIVFTGVRPGEKLFEELAYTGEDMIPTTHPSVRIWRTVAPSAARMERIIVAFDRLRAGGEHHWQRATRQAILAALRQAVPEMLPQPLPGVAA